MAVHPALKFGVPPVVVIGGILLHVWVDPQGAHDFWIAVDRWLNGALGFDPEETISSRLGRWLTGKYGEIEQWFAQLPCNFLSLWDPNHCLESIDPKKGTK